MNIKAMILLVLVVSVFLVGCKSNTPTNYAAYNQPQGQPQGQQQNQYVGGGCGVAPSAAYENTPIGDLDSSNSAWEL